MSIPALPEGWRREEIKRTNLSSKTDVIYISPEGERFKSKLDLAKYLGHQIDLSTFDYRTGRINPQLLRKSKRSHGVYDYRTLKNDPAMVNPTRQTLSFFKHPVTVLKTSSGSSVLQSQQIKEQKRKHNLAFGEVKSDNGERTFQLFWSRRLEGQHASNQCMEQLNNIELPLNIRAFNQSLARNEDIFRTIAANLYNDHRAIKGQEKKVLNRIRKEMDEEDALRNLMAFLNPHQPLSHSITISETDITQQEEVVRQFRKKLKEVLEN
ncbi:Methyl-CpG-binding domain protein 2 [Sarcoptes scabiei]|uniref:Methyl-CpG-binding domain protein 2 n=1 Tax=Sarcoptes scabiei TaxID=52283 RepID=A0A132AJX2_SARSC|nr:Methyl-CpG-binding domain protein 2 [Sarcoptes scabiei]KPM10740.1 methyl-CpG-binding domain protein 2-like protein [Sarcoptes scabiei]UXI20571.1 hypothetical protein NH340_JMT06514 [Sarcoptes scabiei]